MKQTCEIYSDIWSVKNDLSACEVSVHSRKKWWFDCYKCNHDYEQLPDKKFTRNYGCPYCSKYLLCGVDGCLHCDEASCKIYASMWSCKNKKSYLMVRKYSNSLYIFNCSTCKHEYSQKPATVSNGNGCPYCIKKILCSDISCVSCTENSCSRYSDIWSSKNLKTTREVFTQSIESFIFDCKTCYHEYEQKPVYKIRNNSTCVYCTNKKLCEDISCTICKLKSCYVFLHKWSVKNTVDPRMVFAYTHTKYWWTCNTCKDDYLQRPRMFRGCPLCKNKTESVVNTYLKNNKFNFLKEFVIPGSLRRYDFLLKDFNLIIEVDGEQHFKTVKHFRLSAADNQKNDMEKWLYARDHGYSILRISQLDIYKNKIDWKNIILENMIIRHQPDIIYASFDEKLYDEFKSQFPNSSC